MDYRCPLCRTDLGRRKLTQAAVVRMERECSGCRGVIQLNVHRAEEIVVLVGFGAVAALAALAYRLQSADFALAAFGAAMLGALALPLVERTWLRSWPRYRAAGPSGFRGDGR